MYNKFHFCSKGDSNLQQASWVPSRHVELSGELFGDYVLKRSKLDKEISNLDKFCKNLTF